MLPSLWISMSMASHRSDTSHLGSSTNTIISLADIAPAMLLETSFLLIAWLTTVGTTQLITYCGFTSCFLISLQHLNLLPFLKHKSIHHVLTLSSSSSPPLTCLTGLPNFDRILAHKGLKSQGIVQVMNSLFFLQSI